MYLFRYYVITETHSSAISQSVPILFQVNVLCMDTGVKINQVCINSLYSLSSILTSKPPLVIPCKLHGVISTRADGLWWTFDNQLLWGTIRNKMVRF